MTHSRVLFLVPARGGSVRVRGKNLRPIGGIPLVARAIRAARHAAASLDDPAVVLCSTDDDAIAAVALAWHAEVIDRPASLATAEATSVDVALHALDELERRGEPVGTLVLVQPTAPLITAADLLAALDGHEVSGRPIVGVRGSHPATWHVEPGPDGELVRLPPGPVASTVLAGAVYVITPGQLRSGRSFTPPDARAHLVPPAHAIDVDEEEDLLAAEAILASAPARTFELGGRTIGEGPVFVIAEAGVNHDGDPTTAHRLIDAAADAGADSVKFQTFDPDALASSVAPTAAYQQRAGATDDQRAMLRALALPDDAWPGLQDHARERGLVFLSSPFDDASAGLLDRLDVPAFKVASGELTNTPFLQRLAGMGRPLLVSTGMADMVEVADAVDAMAAAGDPPIALFHCVSSYPASPEDANLRAIETMRRAFGVPVGWSDHTPGIELPVAAVALGATLVEKHLTLDRSRPGPDHAASLEPDEFRRMVDGIRIATAARGDGVKRPVAAEGPIAAVARKSLHWAVSMPAGSSVEAAHLTTMRPGTGLRPGDAPRVAGRTTARAVVAGMALVPEDLAPAGEAGAQAVPGRPRGAMG